MKKLVPGLLLYAGLVVIMAFFAAASDDAFILADKVSGASPLLVHFTVNSTAAIQSYSWDFDEDGNEDSTDAAPQFIFGDEGNYEVQLKAMTTDNRTITVTKAMVVASSMMVSVTATPATGIAPLVVQFTSVATGKDPWAFAWDFNGDGTADSTAQNPSTTFDAPGQYNVSVMVTDATGTRVVKTVPVVVALFESHINVSSYFPENVAKGENQITFIVNNNGDKILKDINAKIIGRGIQHLSSTLIASLKPGDQDSLTVKMNVLEAGKLEGAIKVLDSSFPVTFTVAQEVEYNKEELETRLTVLKQRLDEQDSIYYDKKSQGYLVSEVFESIKAAKKQLQDGQQQLLTGKFAEATVNLDLASSAVDDLTTDLNGAKKQEVTFMMWMKENAVAITAVIAAIGALSGILVKVGGHAKKAGAQAVKLTESVKNKITAKKNGEKKEEHHSEPVADEEKKEESGDLKG